MSSRQVMGTILSVVAIAAGGAPVVPAEERTVQAVTPWEARARIFVTGPQQAFLVAVFAGRFAVENGPSPLDGAQLACPAAVEADYAAKAQRGEGRCVITTGSGDRLFARWICAGEPDKGCTGRFVLTGGTGAYQGVTGDGDFVLRLILSDLIHFERLEAEYDLAGLAAWPGLRYRTP
jgi:hypothetical protein